MNVKNIVEAMSKEFNVEIRPRIFLTGITDKYYVTSSISLPSSETKVQSVIADLFSKTVSVYLLHKCTRSTNKRTIETVPHLCPYCGVTAVSKDDADALGLTINDDAKLKIVIRVIGPEHYDAMRIKQGFELNNLYAYEGRWVHICSSMRDGWRWQQTRITTQKFPKKCRKCNLVLGSKDMTLDKAFKTAAFVKR